MRQEFDDASLATYVVCATSPRVEDWIVFKPKDQGRPITDEQVYATVRQVKGLIPYSFMFQRVQATDANNARSKTEGNALEYLAPAVVLRQKGRTVVGMDELQKLRQKAAAKGPDLSGFDDIFGDLFKKGPKR
ncbi:MAG: hypothetical protein MRY79_00230 [Alphaproteobacteria bacterium]|nr:hypothetical protein [Alphaproteobacteria bacterium]